MKYKILKNDRKGYGYNDPNLSCTNCGCITTRYVDFIENPTPNILCTDCLLDIVDEMRLSLLKDI